MKIRALKALFLAALALVPGYFLLSEPAVLGRRSWAGGLEGYVRERIPVATELRQLGLDLRLLGGAREQNGIFINEAGLMRNIDAPLEPYVRGNSDAIARFGEELLYSSNNKKRTYLAIIPTAGGVLQQNLPRFAGSRMVKQQRLIEDVYNRVSDSVRTVDVYSALQSRRDQYIYYHTENNLTSLGGYYTFVAIGRRLGINSRSLSLSQFDIEYVDHAYYGDLYQSGTASGWSDSTAPFRGVEPDILSLFRYSRSNRQYAMTKRTGGVAKTYYTLFPTHLMETGSKMDVYLGGTSAITDIRNSSPYKTRLLVFGDKTAGTYLPFLANHFQQVTLVDLYHMTEADFATINPGEYDQVLFVYGIESFIHTSQPALISRLVWDDGA